MAKFASTLFVACVVLISPWDFVLSRPSELFGSGVPQTGSKWPPYPGAGLDYWALQAGFYGPQGTANLKERNDMVVSKISAKKHVPVVATAPKMMVNPTPNYAQPFYVQPHMVIYG